MSPQEDYLIRAVGGDGSIRVVAARTTQTTEEARRRHLTAPTATAALGRVLTATSLLAATLKPGQRLTMRVMGSGPLGSIVADGQAGGGVRGYVQNPNVHLPLRPDGKLDVGNAVGLPGMIHVTRDLGLKEPYTGTAPLVSGEIGEDLTAYLVRSEQTPSLVALGVLVARDSEVAAAGGILIQLLPEADDSWAVQLERNAQALTGISRQIDAGMSPEDLVSVALQGFDYSVLERSPVRFQCLCSYERAQSLLISLGPAELRDILAKEGQAELTCHFCGTQYRFNSDQILAMLETPRGEQPETS